MQVKTFWYVSDQTDTGQIRHSDGKTVAFTTHEETAQCVSEALASGAYELKIRRTDIA